MFAKAKHTEVLVDWSNAGKWDQLRRASWSEGPGSMWNVPMATGGQD